MATVNDAGITGRDLPWYISELSGIFTTALGSGLDLSAETPQSQIIAALAAMFAETDAALVAVGNRSFNTAAGYQLDDYGALLDIRRRAGARTVVNAVLGGDIGFAAMAGMEAQDAQGNLYRLDAGATLAMPPDWVGNTQYHANDVVHGFDGVNYIYLRDHRSNSLAADVAPFAPAGYAAVTFTAAAIGAQPVPVDGLELRRRFLGLTGVWNKAAGVTGLDAESDDAYRRRFAYAVGRNASGTVPAIIAALTDDTTQVQEAWLLENPTTQRDYNQIIPGARTSFGDPVVGGVVTASLADVIALEAGIGARDRALSVDYGGNDFVIRGAGISLAGAANFNEVAARLQTAIRAMNVLVDMTTVVYRENRFEIVYGTNSPGDSPPFILDDGPLANALGLSAAGGASTFYLPGCSIAPLVDWGAHIPTAADRQALVNALRASKPAGIRTWGAQGGYAGIFFYRYTDVVRLPLAVAAIIRVDADFPDDGIQQMQNGLADYINSLPLNTTYNLQAMWGRMYRVPGWQWGNNAADATPGTDFVISGATTLNEISRYSLDPLAVRITVLMQ